uniref:Uncharacterized protein n=1 Tax=Romanomermis culicivorax TaxID=13658 RepID=A0A915KBK6_ROMCU
VEQLLLKEAQLKNTKPELIFTHLLSATSILLSPDTRLKILADDMEYDVIPNIYLLSVCRSGGGKSQAYSNFFGNPLKEIEQSKRLPQLVFQDFTSSSLMRAIKDAGQCLIWASDEFGAGLTHALNPKDKEWRGFRAMLNSFYSGTGMTLQRSEWPFKLLSYIYNTTKR